MLCMLISLRGGLVASFTRNGYRKLSVASWNGVGILGVCEDRNSSYLRGPALAPQLIRKALGCDSSNCYSEIGIDTSPYLQDYGDVHSATQDSGSVHRHILPSMRDIVARDQRTPLILGGDHSISFPAVRALVDVLEMPVVIVHFDAHPDLYEDFEGNPSSHASPFARILETPSLCSQLISIGIRTATRHQREQMQRYKVRVIEAKDFPAKGGEIGQDLGRFIQTDTPVYLTVDMDVLEPGLAPGVSHREAGGLTVRQLMDAIHAIPGRLVGADLVEYNPLQDVKEITASVASKLVKEIAAKMIKQHLH